VPLMSVFIFVKLGHWGGQVIKFTSVIDGS
jgi:hypothetical protein